MLRSRRVVAVSGCSDAAADVDAAHSPDRSYQPPAETQLNTRTTQTAPSHQQRRICRAFHLPSPLFAQGQLSLSSLGVG